ncbi:MAG: tetratricopeptide repeat protein [Saprospiraceae bacterium]|nr:tetratricopeptide repeat protein [Saprospiraceae bacterium]
MNVETLHQQLDAWEEGRLTHAEIADLHHWLQNNPEAYMEQVDRQLVAALMEYSIAQDLRKKFADTPVRTISPLYSVKRVALIAAISLVIIVTGALVFAAQGGYNHSDIVADFSDAVAIPYTGALRGENSVAASSLQFIILLIEDGQSDLALIQLEDKLRIEPEQSNLVYLKGYAMFRNGQFQDALELFNTIPANDPFDFADDLRWNTVLCKLNLEFPVTNIKQDLDSILANPRSAHQGDAKSLNNQLGSFWYWMANLIH